MFMKSLGLIPLSIFMVLVLTIGIASAYPGVPIKFYGKVTINGVSAPDGILVEARVFDDYVSGTTTSGGTYGQETEAFYVPNPHGTMDGKTIEFYVQNVKAAETIFKTPTAEETSTELDLSVTIPNFCGDGKCESGESCSSCPGDCGTCESGGNGGGGNGGNGGGLILPSPEEEEEEGTCVEDWMCTEWSECVNGKQSRTCADLNRCGTTENKPAESEDCLTPTGSCEPGQTMCRGNVLMACSSDGKAWVDLEECEFGCSEEGCMEGGFNLTGMLTGLPAVAGAIAGVIVIIIILTFYFVKIRK